MLYLFSDYKIGRPVWPMYMYRYLSWGRYHVQALDFINYIIVKSMIIYLINIMIWL